MRLFGVLDPSPLIKGLSQSLTLNESSSRVFIVLSTNLR